MTNRWTRSIGLTLIMFTALFGSANATERQHFALSFFVFEGLTQTANDHSAPALVQQAVSEASAVLGYRGARLVDRRTWLVRSDGDMARTLDYRGTSIKVADQADVRFALRFDSQARFLTLIDLVLSSDADVLLHTSIGIEDQGAAVAGVIQPERDGREYFIVLTFQVSSAPFPGQSANAVFTVIDDWDATQPAQ